MEWYFGFDCIADDTALECKALDGLPGIYSSNYGAVNEHIQQQDISQQTMEVYNEEVSKEMFSILHSKNKTVQKPLDHDTGANIEKLLKNLEGKVSSGRTVICHYI